MATSEAPEISPSSAWPEIFTAPRIERLATLPGPILTLWGWPGSGKRLLLTALLADPAGGAEVTAADLADAERLRGRQEEAAARGLRWLVSTASGPAPAPELAAALGHQPPLVLGVERLRPWGRTAAVRGEGLSARDFRLGPEEVRALWHHLAEQELPAAEAERLCRATDGWYRPLALAAAAANDGEEPRLEPEALVRLPALAAFLEQRVCGSLPRPLRRLLPELALERHLHPAFWAEALRGRPEAQQALEQLVEEMALVVEEAGAGGEPEWCLPRLLQHFLEQRRELHWTPDQRAMAHGRLGLAHCALGHWSQAQEHLRAAGDEERADRLLRGAPGARRSAAVPKAAPRAVVVPPSPLLPAEPPEAAFQVELFGPPRVRRVSGDGKLDEVHWVLKRSEKLFAYLASSPQLRAAKTELVEALWVDEDRAAIRRNFHPTLSHLRRSLGGGRARGLQPVLHRGGFYQLSPAYAWRIDVWELEAAVERGRRLRRIGDPEAAVEEYRSAWRLYRGVYLEGVYDPWVVTRRETLGRLYLSLLRELGDVYTELGRSGEALDAYRAVLVEDPMEELVQVALMRLYAAQGRRDLVRRQYDRLGRILQEELGVEPLAQTTEEYHRLMGR